MALLAVGMDVASHAAAAVPAPEEWLEPERVAPAPPPVRLAGPLLLEPPRDLLECRLVHKPQLLADPRRADHAVGPRRPVSPSPRPPPHDVLIGAVRAD
jgi:hypothetical protein